MTRPAPQPGPVAAVGFRDRLLAEAVRAFEHDGAQPRDEPDADSAAAAAEGDFEQRLVVRARSMTLAGRLEQALRNTRGVIVVIALLGVLLAAVGGFSAARASLVGEHNVVNVFWALGGLLGIQTLLLAAWLIVMIMAPHELPTLSLGGAVLGIARRLSGRWHRSAESLASIEATGVVLARGAIGRWTLSSISNGLWLAFNAACVLFLVLILSTNLYRFVWETTILPSGAYVTLTRTIGWLPSQLGFPVPSPGQIAASDGAIGPDDSEATRHAWSGLLVGGVVTYGLVPRFALLVLCLWQRGRACRRYRLDTSRPGFLRLRSRLMPASRRLGVIDAETPGEAELDLGQAAAAPPRSHGGAPAVFAVEIDPPATPWPPAVGGVRWRDLGFVDGRADRQRVLAELGNGTEGPAVTVAVCGLTTTPDRGIAAFLNDVKQAVGSRMAMVLTGGETLRKRVNGGNLATRVEDWRTLAGSLGVAGADVIELDLDNLTDVSLAKLASLVGGEGAGIATQRRIDDAFDTIVEHVRGWPPPPSAPDTKQQAALHTAIGGLYRSEMTTWTQRFRLPDVAALKDKLPETLRSGAKGIVGVLPKRLKVDTRWVASGAVAGALGCVTAAMLVSPAAIAALPMWSAVGAALTAAVRATVRTEKPGEAADAADGSERADAVRAAALFALLLELQGRDEAAISRILDAVIADAGDDELGSAESVQRSLDAMRHRLDLALAAEGRP